jgi:hypothetical protein
VPTDDYSPFKAAIERRPRGHNDERICVIYFENRDHYVIVAPDHRHPTPAGFERRECHTLREIDQLTARLNRQDTDMFTRLMAQDREAIRRRHSEIRSKLGQRLLAADCSSWERMFIQSMYRYMDRKEEELTRCEVRGYFHQREYDSPGRDPVEQHGRQLEATVPKMSDRLAAALSR